VHALQRSAAATKMGEQYMHTVYKNAHRETTEWDDAQRRLGNLPALPPLEKAAAWASGEDALAGGASEVQAALDARALRVAPRARLEAAEEGTEDDRVLEEYRRAQAAAAGGMAARTHARSETATP
jgi:hypothetical protein